MEREHFRDARREPSLDILMDANPADLQTTRFATSYGAEKNLCVSCIVAVFRHVLLVIQ